MKAKKLLSFILSVAMLLGLVAVPGYATWDEECPGVVLSAVKDGDDITVTVSIDKAADLISFGFELYYPTDKVTLKSTKDELQKANNGFFIKDGNKATIGLNSGYVSFAIALDENLAFDKDDMISKIVFSRKNAAEGEINFELKNVKVGHNQDEKITAVGDTAQVSYPTWDEECPGVVLSAVEDGDDITVTVSIDKAADLISFGFELYYPTDKVTLKSTKDELQKANNGFFIKDGNKATIGLNSGYVSFAIALDENLAFDKDDMISKIVFTLDGELGGVLDFALKNVKVGRNTSEKITAVGDTASISLPYTSLALTGDVTEPAKGKTDATNVSAPAAAADDFTVAHAWTGETKAGASVNGLENGKFAASTKYTSTITVTPKQGTTLSNGFTVSYDGYTFAEQDGAYVGSKTFDYFTDDKSLESIAVTTAPTKTAYTYGEAFDPAGMVVTGTYDDLSTDTLAETAYTITPEKLTVDTHAVYITAKDVDIDAAWTLITVAQKEVELDWADTSFTYDGEAHKPTATVKSTSLVGSDVCTVTVEGEQANVGLTAFTATATALSNANYKLPDDATTTFTITPATVTVTPIAATKTYGSDDPTTLGWTCSPTLIAGNGFVGELSRVAGEDVGEYAITIGDLSICANYTIELAEVKFTITPAPLTITANANQKKTYGEDDPALTYTSNGLKGTDTISGVLEREEGENVGTYAITQGSLTAGNNYTISFTGADFEITKADAPAVTVPTLDAVTYDPDKTLENVTLSGDWAWVTPTTVPTVTNSGYPAALTVDDANYDYTGVDGYNASTHKVTRTVALTVNKAEVAAPTIASKVYNAEAQTAAVEASDLYTVTTNAGGTNVGSYNVVLTLADAANYKWTDSDEATKTLTFQITKATAPTVTVPTPEAVTYDPAKTLNDVALTGGWAWVDDSTVPTVPVSGYAAELTVDDANYDYTGVDGYNASTHKVTRTVALTVNKADPTYTVPSGLTATYGQTLEDVSLTTGWTWDDPTTSVGNAGTNSFSATFTPDDTDNYNTAAKTLNITVGKASATGITGAATLNIYHGTAGEQALQIADFVFKKGDDTITLAGKEFATDQTGATVFENTAHGAVTLGDNRQTYTLNTANAALDIGKTATWDVMISSTNYEDFNATVTLNIINKESVEIAITITGDTVYGGTYTVTPSAVMPSGVNADPDGYTVTYSGTPYDGTTFDAGTTAPTKAGDYTVSVKYEDSIAHTTNNVAYPGYTGRNTKDFTISKKTLTVTAAAKNKTYGDPDPDLTYTQVGLESGDAITGTLARTGDENVGTYAITLGSLTAGNNYSISFTEADFEITQAPLTITANANQYKTYGDADPALTYSSSGLKGTDTISGKLGRAEGEDVGTYAITQGTLTAGNNYSISFTGADFEITPAPLTITANANQYKTYGDADPALTYSSSGLKGTDTISGKLGRAEGEDVGTYAFNLGTLDAGGNYEIALAGTATFEIKKADWPADKKTASGEAKYGTSGEVDLSSVLAELGEGGAVTVTNISDNNQIFDGVPAVNTIITDGKLSYKLKDDEALKEKTATVTVSVTNAKNYENYAITVTIQLLDKYTQTVTFTNAAITKTYGDAKFSVSAGSAELPSIKATYAVTDGDAVSVDATTGEVTILKAGKATITATVAGNDDYKNGTNDCVITVNQKAITITADSDTKVYDGTALTKNSFTNTDLASGDTISVTVTGSQTVFGESNNVPSAAVIKKGDTDVTASYDITYVNGKLNVTKKAITITAGSAEKVYDGMALTKDSFTNTDLAAGDTLTSVTVTGSQTVVGSSSNVPSAAVIKNASDENVTDSYDITYANGTLKVTKKAVTITADSDEKVYDGTALTKDGYTNTDLAAGDTLTSVTVTGSQTDAGSSDNVPSDAVIKKGDTDVTASYEITYVNGTLAVTKAASSVVTAPVAKTELKYTGSALALVTEGTAEGGTIQYRLGTSGDFSATIPTATDAGDYTVYYMVVGDANHNDTEAAGPVNVSIEKADHADVDLGTVQVGCGQPGTVDIEEKIEAGNVQISTNVEQDGTYTVVSDVNVEGGVLSFKVSDDANAIGKTATITVEVSNATNYKTYQIKVTVTSVKNPQVLSFASDSVTKTVGDADFTQAVTGAAAGSTVTYSSGDESIATVDETGKVHVIKAGTVTITANASETATYLAGSASYTLTVSSPVYYPPADTGSSSSSNDKVTTETTTTENEDGSVTETTVQTGTVTNEDGSKTTGTTTTETTTAADGSVTEKVTESSTTTNKDGSKTEKNSETETTTAADGSVTEKATETSTTTNKDGSKTETATETEATTAADGSKTEKTSETSTTTNKDGSKTETATESEAITAADGSKTEKTSETSTTTNKDGSKTEKATETETSTAANGSVTEKATETETTTAADGSKTEKTTDTSATTAADGSKTEKTSETSTTTAADGSVTEKTSDTEATTAADGSRTETRTETADTTTTNEDGSVTTGTIKTETATTTAADGTSTSKETVTEAATTTNSVTNDDGSKTDTVATNETLTETNTAADGSSAVTATEKGTTKETTSTTNEDGTTTATTVTEKTEKTTETATDADGNVTESVTEKTESKNVETTVDADGKTTGSGTLSGSATTTDADGNVSTSVTEGTVEVTTDEAGTITEVTTATTTTTDAEGEVTEDTTITTDSLMTNGNTGTVVENENGETLDAAITITQQAIDESKETDESIVAPATVSVGATVRFNMPRISTNNVAVMPRVEVGVKRTGPGIVAFRRLLSGLLELIKECVPSSVIVPVSTSCEIVIEDNTKTFTDVNTESWYGESVTFVTAREIFNGNGDGTFAPSAQMNRAMVAQIIYNLDRNATAGDGSVFSDVEAGKWYNDAIGWAASNGIITGYNGEYNPTKAVTRQDLVTIMYRYATMAGYDVSIGEVDTDAFSDWADVSDYAADAMRWAISKGIITGYTDGTLRPKATTTRAEVAAVMQRMIVSEFK